MTVKIESGIEIPPDPRGVMNRKYPLADLEIGDSILMPVNSASGCISQAQKKTGFFFTRRRVSKQSFRVWRVATPQRKRKS